MVNYFDKIFLIKSQIPNKPAIDNIMQTTRSQHVSTPLLLPHSDPELHHQSGPNSPERTTPIIRSRHSNTNLKTSYNFHRNNKSLKLLNIHLRQYRQSTQKNKLSTLIENVNTIIQNNYEMSMSNTNSIVFNNNKNSNTIKNSSSIPPQQQPHMKNSINLLSMQQTNASNFSPVISKSKKQLKTNTNGDQSTSYSFNKKCQQLVDNLIFNLTIFKKVFQTTKKKRTVFSKLYGWDPMFNPVFFSRVKNSPNDQNQNNYSQQFKPNITRQSVMHQLNLQKKSFTSKNIYNKLRLFVAELTKANITHQQFQSKQQKLKLLQSSIKLRDYLQRLSQSPKTKISTLNQIENMRQTHYDMINMKMKIKNKGDEIKKFGNSGSYGGSQIKIHPFFLKEEKNVSDVESFIKAIIKK